MINVQYDTVRPIWALLFLLAVLVGKSLQAQSDSASSPESAHRVFIPVDSQGMPTGNFYYLPESLRQELLQVQRLGHSSEKGWGLVTAHYQGVFSTNPKKALHIPLSETSGVYVNNFKVTFEVDLETENAMIVLPAMPLFSDIATWDGQPVQPRFWNIAEVTANEQSGKTGLQQNQARTVRESGYLVFSLTRQRPGRHKLELLLNPPVTQINETRHCLSFEIPPVPNATLELSLSPDTPTISVEDSYGVINNEPGQITAQLGPTNRLTLSWIDESPKSGQAVVETEQLFWLRARPNQIDIAALYKFRVSSGKVQTLDIAADPKMQLIGSPLCVNSDVRIERTEPVPNTEGLYRLYFAESMTGSITIQANYLYQRNFSGIGVVRLPNIPQLSRTRRSLIGISLDPTLECPHWLPSNFPIERFHLDWGPTDDVPVAVYNLAALDPHWMLEIRTRKTEIQARIRQSVIVRSGQANTQFEASLRSTGGVFKQVLLVPEEYTISSIELKDNQNVIPVRWGPRSHTIVDLQQAQSNQGRGSTDSENLFNDDEPVMQERRYKEVTIFAGRPVSGMYDLTVYGRSTFTETELQKSPLLVLKGVEVESNRLDLYRDSSVLIRPFAPPASWIRLNSTETAPTTWNQAVPVGSWMIQEKNQQAANQESRNPYSSDQAIPATTIWTVLPNHPVISGRQITQLVYNRNTDCWDVVVDLNLSINGGELNTLRIRYDEKCSPAPTISPPMRWEILSIQETNGRDLILTPVRPLSGQVQLSIRTPINATLDRVALPQLFFETEPSLPHYIILPNDLNLKPIDWERKQLSRINIGDIPHLTLVRQPGQSDSISTHGEMAEPDPYAGLSAYLVIGPDYEVAIAPSGRQPTVQLNDVSLFLKRNGTLSGVSSFDLQGDGVDSCLLIMPEGLELLQLKSGGITSRGREIAPGQWKVDLWPNNLPQKVEVVFRGELLHSRYQGSVHQDSVSTIPLFSSSGLEVLLIPLPRLDSVQIVGTVWTLTFEKSDHDPPHQYTVRSLEETPEFVTVQTTQVLSHAKWTELEKNILSPLSYREAIPIVARIDLLRLSSMTTMLENTIFTVPPQRSDLINWYSHWGENWWSLKKELDSLLVLQKEGDQSVWIQSVFRSKEPSSGTFITLLDSLQNVNQSSQVFAEEYARMISRLGLESQDRELSESEIPQTDVFSIFRMNQPDDVLYLFGVSRGHVGAIEVFSLPESRRIWEHAVVRWAGGIILIVAGFWGIRRLHPKRLFRQFPFFISTVISVLLWLILTPGFLGLLLLPLIWLAMIWPSWRA